MIYRGIQGIQYYWGKHKICSGLQGIRDNISESLYRDGHELLGVYMETVMNYLLMSKHF